MQVNCNLKKDKIIFKLNMRTMEVTSTRAFCTTFRKKCEKTVFFSRFSRHFVQSSHEMQKNIVFWAFCVLTWWCCRTSLVGVHSSCRVSQSDKWIQFEDVRASRTIWHRSLLPANPFLQKFTLNNFYTELCCNLI